MLQRMKTRKKRVANRAVRKKVTTIQDTTAVVTYRQETVPGNNFICILAKIL